MDSLCCASQLYGPSFIWNTIPNTLRTPAVLNEIWTPRSNEDNACALSKGGPICTRIYDDPAAPADASLMMDSWTVEARTSMFAPPLATGSSSKPAASSAAITAPVNWFNGSSDMQSVALSVLAAVAYGGLVITVAM